MLTVVAAETGMKMRTETDRDAQLKYIAGTG